jgi:hypothetical protein
MPTALMDELKPEIEVTIFFPSVNEEIETMPSF